MDQILFKTKIGLPLVSFIVIGMMIGGGVFVYTGIVYDMTGPALPFAYAMAVIPVFISMLPLAMMGSAMPVSGANYLYPSRMISPALAFAAVWVYALASFFGQIPLYVIATSNYLETVFPSIPIIPVALGVLTLFYVLNLLGIKIAAQIQGVLLVSMIAALVLFAFRGSTDFEPTHFNNFFQKGSGSIILGLALLSFTYFGANGIIELGAEIKNPGRTIPRAFFIAFPLVALVYVAVATGLIGSVSPESILADEDPLVLGAKRILKSSGYIFFVFGGAILALLTTLNALFIIGTRSLLMIVHDGLLPKVFGIRSKKKEVPYVLLTLIWLLSVVGVLSGFSLETFASYAALGGLFIFLPILLSAWIMPKRYPVAYQQAKFKLTKPWLKFTVLVGLVMVVFFGFIILYDLGSLLKSGLFLLFIGSGFVLFYLRVSWLKKNGLFRKIKNTPIKSFDDEV